jgi:hypothetical protein
VDEMGEYHPLQSEAAHVLDILKRVDNEIWRNDKSFSFKVMSVWGVSGVGTSALVRSIYQGQMQRKYRDRWGKYAWVNIRRPFSLEKFQRSLLWDLCSITTEHEEKEYFGQSFLLDSQCQHILREHRCLLVIAGLESIVQWKKINKALKLGEAKGHTIVITCEESIAMYCADNPGLACNIEISKHDAARHLLKHQVCLFERSINFKSTCMTSVITIYSKVGSSQSKTRSSINMTLFFSRW